MCYVESATLAETYAEVLGGAKAATAGGTFKTLTINRGKDAQGREKRLVQGLVSVAVPDMDGEVVIPGGLDFSYFPTKVKAVYWSHDYKQMPVGVCRNLSVRDNGNSLFATTHVLQGAFGDDLLTAMEAGAVNGFSIGFGITEAGPPTAEEQKRYGKCDTVIRKGKLIEYSITPMPSCPDALVELVSKSYIHRSSAVAFGLPDTASRKLWAVSPRTLVVGRKLVV